MGLSFNRQIKFTLEPIKLLILIVYLTEVHCRFKSNIFSSNILKTNYLHSR